MAFCTNCGNELKENEKFCPECGAEQVKTGSAEAPYIPPIADIPTAGATAGGNPESPAVSTHKERSLNIAQLVWALINVVLCCMPLGVASLVMTIMAKDAPTEEESAKKLKTAKICNIIGTIGGVVIYALYIFLMVVGMLLGDGGAA